MAPRVDQDPPGKRGLELGCCLDHQRAAHCPRALASISSAAPAHGDPGGPAITPAEPLTSSGTVTAALESLADVLLPDGNAA